MKISEQQFRELLDRYLNNTASAEERSMLDTFFESYQSEAPDEALPDDAQVRRAIFERINARIAQNTGRPKTNLVRLWLPVAASVSLFILAFLFFKDNKLPAPDAVAVLVEAQTPAGVKSLKQLPDGTAVYLNSNSSIVYAKDFSNGAREVTLTGEAYFEVVKDTKPFIVRAATMQTEVLGTTFNVKNISGSRVEVTLVEGSVNVKSGSGESLLRPSELAIVDVGSGAIETRSVDVTAFTGWKDNILFFEDTHLGEAITTIESWYAVEIDIVSPGLEECVITAKYQDEPLGNVLSSLQFLLNLEVERMDKAHYRISGRACKQIQNE